MKLNNEKFQESFFKSQGEVIINNKKVSYDIISEDNVILSDDGRALGSIFSFSYIRNDIEDNKNRPVIFAYNGGPGSSSLWLHIGLLGPRRAKIDDPINIPIVPPFELEDNPHSLLDICDIVMIDPVDCGYGKLIDPQAASEFFSIEKDAQSIAIFIKNWLIKHNRWNSPKYLLGESYGTVRSSVLANILMGGPTTSVLELLGISINGIIMLGTTIPVNAKKSLMYTFDSSIEDSVIYLPTMAATNWYHNNIQNISLSNFVEEAYEFAAEEYLKNLYLGNRLSKEEEDKFRKKLAYYTGISEDYLEERNYRITLKEFASELLREKGLKVGEYDSRYTLKYSNNIGMEEPISDEAAMGQYTPLFVGAMDKYLKEELKIDFIRPYNVINFKVNRMFKPDHMKQPIEYLRAALRRNKSLNLFIGSGYYDLVTTIGAARYMAANLPKDQVTLKEYESGHMSYIGEKSAKELRKDLEDFIVSSK